MMPISPSAFKRMRSDVRKHELNQAMLSHIRSAKKVFRLSLGKDFKEAEQKAQALISLVDKAASKGTIPKGRANRLKSRAGLALKKLRASSAKQKRL